MITKKGRIQVGHSAVLGHNVWIRCRQRIQIDAQTLVARGATIFDVYQRHTCNTYLAVQRYTNGESSSSVTF